MNPLTYTTVATSNQNGALVETLSAGQITSLAYTYLTNYAQFIQDAATLINQDVQSIERNEPEGQRNYLVIAGWNGMAGHAADAINSRWQAGKVIGSNGQPVGAWPEYPSQLAWATGNNDQLELRWLKEEWQLYLLVFTLIAVVGYLVYRVLSGGSYTLQTANAAQSPGASPNPIQIQGGLKIFGIAWYWYALGGGALAVTPWAYKKVVEIKEDRALDLDASRALKEAR